MHPLPDSVSRVWLLHQDDNVLLGGPATFPDNVRVLCKPVYGIVCRHGC